MTPLQGMGVPLTFEPGPVVREPIRTLAQVEALPALVPERDVPFVLETIRLVRAACPRGVPLIGFAGAPFTLLCYLVSGRPSKEFGGARAFLYAQPDSRPGLLSTSGTPWGSIWPRRPRRGPGADAVRIVGRPARAAANSPASRCRRCGAPWRCCASAACRSSITSTRASALMAGGGRRWTWMSSASTGAVALAGAPLLGPAQGSAGEPRSRRALRPPRRSCGSTGAVMTEAGSAPGHIFNLGHGIWPDTEPDAVARLIDYVHEHP